MEDTQILNEERKVFLVGPKKKRLELKMLGISKYYDEFVPRFTQFLLYFQADTERMTLPTGKSWKYKKKMETLRSQLRRVFSYAMVRKDFIRLLKEVGYLRFSDRYFNEYVTPKELAEIFLRVYKFNIDDFKKKLSEIADSILESDPQLRTYIGASSSGDGSNRLQKSPGFRERLPARFRNLEKLKSRSSRSSSSSGERGNLSTKRARSPKDLRGEKGRTNA